MTHSIKQEQQHLDKTLKIVDKLIHKTNESSKNPVTSQVEAKLKETTLKKNRHLIEAKKSPYFGSLDLLRPGFSL